MKVLHIVEQDFTYGILNGGQQVAKKNNNMLKVAFGEKNAYSLIFTKHMRDENVNNVFFLPLVSGGTIRNYLVSLLGYRRFSPIYKRKVKEIIDKVNPDVVFLDSSELGKVIGWLNNYTKCIVHFHNIEVDYIWKNKIRRKQLYAIPMLLATYANERLVAKRSDKIICLNERDNRRLQKIYNRSADLILPVGFEDKFKYELVNRDVNDHKLIFIGSCFMPNYQGIKWFVENVMLKLKGYELIIVGRGFENKRNELEKDNVKVIGSVENLDKYYYSYCSVVMPILYGDGMKVKTAEAMMYGMNIFATSEALEGYQVENVGGIYRCDTADEFVDSIVKAYEEHHIYEFADEVRQSFLDNNGIETQIEKIKELVNI